MRQMRQLGVGSLAGLNEGLRVRHIAASPVLTCDGSGHISSLAARPEFTGIDQIPIREEGRITGLWEHSDEWVRRPLDESVLVSADAPLWHFIHTVHQQPYRLVLEQTEIIGIVTWSDLLKTPVLVLAFSLLAELERTMNRRILDEYPKDSWLKLLDKTEQKKISSRHRKLQQENLALPLIELADLWHKARLLRDVIGLGRNFEIEFDRVVKLRNDVDHVKDIVRSDADLQGFVQHLETAEAWLELLNTMEGGVAAAAVATRSENGSDRLIRGD
jgi:hypothetical protein